MRMNLNQPTLPEFRPTGLPDWALTMKERLRKRIEIHAMKNQMAEASGAAGAYIIVQNELESVFGENQHLK